MWANHKTNSTLKNISRRGDFSLSRPRIRRASAREPRSTLSRWRSGHGRTALYPLIGEKEIESFAIMMWNEKPTKSCQMSSMLALPTLTTFGTHRGELATWIATKNLYGKRNEEIDLILIRNCQANSFTRSRSVAECVTVSLNVSQKKERKRETRNNDFSSGNFRILRKRIIPLCAERNTTRSICFKSALWVAFKKENGQEKKSWHIYVTVWNLIEFAVTLGTPASCAQSFICLRLSLI